MIPFGEDSAKLLPSREQAEAWSADFISIQGVMNIENQRRLSGHSLEFIKVKGRFDFDPDCWISPTDEGSRCFPALGLAVKHAQIEFLEHPDPGLSRKLRPRSSAGIPETWRN